LAFFVVGAALSAAPVAADDLEDAFAAYGREDYTTAMRLARPFAEEGDAGAQWVVGAMFLLGQGVPQDVAEAAQWYERSANQGDADAQHLLGQLRDPGGPFRGYGEVVTQDYDEAAKWYRRAADQGNARAQYDLGVLYMRGTGVPRDSVQAHKWCALAGRRSSGGDAKTRKAAKHQRDELARSMTTAQLDEARRLAREWKPKLEGKED
jgi:TPR repeat protein